MIVRRFLLWSRTASASERAAGVAALAEAYLGSQLGPEDRREAETALLALADDASPLVRRAIAEVVAGSDRAPRALILGLIADQGDIAALVLAHSPVLTEGDLVDAAAIGDDLAQRAIAQRPHLGPGLAAALAEIGGEEALVTLCGNPTADIPDSAFDRMVERFGESGAVREALSARADLPPALRQCLALRVSEALASFVSDCGWLTRERSERLARETTDRVAIRLAAGDPANDAGEIVDRLRQEGRLTAALILRSLLTGEPALAVAALASLAGLSVSRALSLLNDRRGAGFGSLYRKAGLPGGLYPAFAAAVAALHVVGGMGASQSGASRRILEQALIACSALEGPEVTAVMALMRRLEAEAAREEARALADSLADDAAFALLMETDPQLLIELDPADLRSAA